MSDNSLAIIQEETFGPVLTIQLFSDETEAIRLANDKNMGFRPASGLATWIDPCVSQALEAGSSGSTIGRRSTTTPRKAASGNPDSGA